MTRDTILVCGSRHWKDWDLFLQWMAHVNRLARSLAPALEALELRYVHGGCLTGADKMMQDYCDEYGDECKSYPVDKAQDGAWPMAGPRRNQRMLDAERSRLLLGVAFLLPGVKCNGTRGMIDLLTWAKIPTMIIGA